MSDFSPVVDLSFLRARTAQKRIAAFTTALVVLAVLYALLAPKWYRATLTVVPTRSQRGGSISSFIGGDLGGLASVADGATGGGADVQRIVAVLQSNDVTDRVIEKFGLHERYSAKFQENARDELWKHCEVKALPKPGFVQLACEDKDPRFVVALLQFFSEYGNQVFRRVGISSASEQVRFLERRANELRAQADESGRRMREFQEKHQIVDLDTQTKAVVSAIATLQGQRTSKQLELDYARTFSSGDEVTLQQLRSQISVMDGKLRDMEESGGVNGTPEKTARGGAKQKGGMFPAALAVPKLREEFETLYRDRKVAEATLVFSLERLEAARADEARDTSTFLVLDPPTLPTRHARPQKSLIVVIGMAVGLFASVVFEWWRATARRPAESASGVRTRAA